MNRTYITAGCFCGALMSAVAVLVITQQTVIPVIAHGAGPNSVQVTSSGWSALLASCLSAGGFTVAGIVTVLANRFGIPISQGSSESLISDVVELTASFTALMSDKTNRAYQRRFFFALVDAANLIQGCEASHDAGVIVLKYSGYADQATSMPGTAL